MAKFTTKQYLPTGRYRSFYHIYAELKYGGKVCGSVEEGSGAGEQEWEVRFMVHRPLNFVTKESPCKWKWVKLKKKFSSIADAKSWLNDPKVKGQILRDLNLYFLID